MTELYFEDTKIMNSLKSSHWNGLSTHPEQPQIDFRRVYFLNIDTIHWHITNSNPLITMMVIVCGLLMTWNSFFLFGWDLKLIQNFKGYHKRYILDAEKRLSRQTSLISQRRVYTWLLTDARAPMTPTELT